jgi:hypothetical protein
MNHFLGDHAFSAGGSVYTWTDVVMAAVQRGDWARLVESLRRRLALVAMADDRGLSPTEGELEAAGQEFRYERDLITAEDMEAWLAREGLTVEDWMEHIERSVVAAKAGEAGEIPAEWDPPAEDVAERLAAEAVCSGALAGFAQTFAEHVAVASDDAAAAGDPSPEQVRQAALTVCEEAARLGLPDLSAGDGRRRVEEIVRVELAFPDRARDLVSSAAVRAEIENHRLDWIRLDLEGLSFGDAAEAREAALCLREDGEDFESVARSAHVRIRNERVFLDELDPSVRTELLSAKPGELVGPLEFGEQFHLFRVREKTIPSESDMDVRRRAESAVLAKMLEEQTLSRILWLERH